MAILRSNDLCNSFKLFILFYLRECLSERLSLTNVSDEKKKKEANKRFNTSTSIYKTFGCDCHGHCAMAAAAAATYHIIRHVMVCILECDYIVFAVRLTVDNFIQYFIDILLLVVLLFGRRCCFKKSRWNIDEKSTIAILLRRIQLTVFTVIDSIIIII